MNSENGDNLSNIFITGATGFVGSHLVQRLSDDKNNTLYCLCRSVKAESPFYALSINKRSNVNLIFGSVSDYNLIEEILIQYDIDSLYHISAKAVVNEAAKIPVSSIKTNIIGTTNILEALRKCDNNISTYIMSTDKAYGISDKLPYTEDLPLNGLDIYSASKACEDILSRSYAHNYNLPIVIGRPSNIYGLDFNWSRIIPSLAKSCLSSNKKNSSLILNKGSHEHIREYTYIDDVVDAIISLTKNIKLTKEKAYNISSNFKHTTKEVVHLFLQITNNKNKKITFRKKEPTFKEIPNQYLDTTKISNVISWSPKYDLQHGMEKTIDMYKKWFGESN